jgi:ABC-2 type transport system permease protein
MIRSLVLRNLRQHLPLLGVLSAGLFLFQLAVVWVAARIDMGPEFRNFLQSFLPPDFVEMVFSQFGFGSFAGTVSFGYQHPMTLVAGLAMVMVLATIPAQERESGLLDLILARPLARTAYLSAAALNVLTAALLMTLVVLGGTAVGLSLVERPEPVLWTAFLPSAEGFFLLLLAVGSYTLLFATGAKRRGIATAQAVGITMVFYWLDFMGDYWDLLETARRLSPFYYFDPARAATSGLTLQEILVLAGIAAVALPAAFLNFRRQDL